MGHDGPVGMDVYAGPLSRYLAGDWATLVEQSAEASGRPALVLRPDTGPAMTAAESHAAALRWQGAVARQLGRDDVHWSDDPTAPYATDKPGLDGYAGVLLLAAYDERPHLDPRRSAPPGAPDSVTTFTAAPAYLAAQAEGAIRFSNLLHHAEWWLPVPKDVSTFVAARPAGPEARVGTVAMLLLELEALRERYGLDDDHLQDVRRYGPPPDGDPWNWGRFGLAAMLPLVRWAAAAGHPVILDY